MAGSGFRVFKCRSVGSARVEKVLVKNSTQFRSGDLLRYNAGVLQHIAAGETPEFLFQHLKTPKGKFENDPADKSSDSAREALAIQIMGGDVLLYSELTGDAQPPIFNQVCNTNTDKTLVLATVVTSDNDYDNGTIFCRELGEQRRITDSQETGGVTTFTVDPPFSRAVTAGNHIDAIPIGAGSKNVKYNATTPHQCIGVAPADNSGGTAKIEEVHLEADPQYIVTSCPDQE